MGCSASRPEIVLCKALEGCAGYFFPSRSCPCPHPLSAGVTATSTAGPSSSPPIPKTLFLPAPVVHHPSIRKGDSQHLVSLISTTYGSLILDDHRPSSACTADRSDGRDFADNSHSPDSVINAWELMEGLDDDEDVSAYSSTEQNPRHSFDTCINPYLRMNLVYGESVNRISDSYPSMETSHEITEEWRSNLENSNSKPLWKLLSEESLASKLDINAHSTYQRASSSRHYVTARTRINTRSADSTPIVSIFSSVTSSPLHSTFSSTDPRQIPDSENKIVLYFTSLRGIRKTYDDCCAIRMILRGLSVSVDERDVSMDSSYRKELNSALGGKPVSLPQVFIRGKHIGGADKIKQLNEFGELTRLIDGFPISKSSGFICRSCGDARFVPCCKCNGSRKVFEEGRRRRCSSCNENGLIRCPTCYS